MLYKWGVGLSPMRGIFCLCYFILRFFQLRGCLDEGRWSYKAVPRVRTNNQHHRHHHCMINYHHHDQHHHDYHHHHHHHHHDHHHHRHCDVFWRKWNYKAVPRVRTNTTEIEMDLLLFPHFAPFLKTSLFSWPSSPVFTKRPLGACHRAILVDK